MSKPEDWIDAEPQASLESTASLLLRVRAGEAMAREELAGRYQSTLRRWAHGRLSGRARDLVDTDDLVQSAIMRALNHVDGFEPRREGAFLAYMRQILLNQLRDEARRARRRPEHVELHENLPGPDRSLLDEVIGKQNMDRYEAALSMLSESHREAVILRVEMGYRYREIAEGMELPTANAARKVTARALVRLAQLMGEADGS